MKKTIIDLENKVATLAKAIEAYTAQAVHMGNDTKCAQYWAQKAINARKVAVDISNKIDELTELMARKEAWAKAHPTKVIKVNKHKPWKGERPVEEHAVVKFDDSVVKKRESVLVQWGGMNNVLEKWNVKVPVEKMYERYIDLPKGKKPVYLPRRRIEVLLTEDIKSKVRATHKALKGRDNKDALEDAIVKIFDDETRKFSRRVKPMSIDAKKCTVEYTANSKLDELFADDQTYEFLAVATDVGKYKFGLYDSELRNTRIAGRVKRLSDMFVKYLKKVGIEIFDDKNKKKTTFRMATHSGAQVKEFNAGFIPDSCVEKFEKTLAKELPVLSEGNKVRATGLWARGTNGVFVVMNDKNTLIVPGRKIWVRVPDGYKVSEDLKVMKLENGKTYVAVADGMTLIAKSVVADESLGYHGAMVQAFAVGNGTVKTEVLIVDDDLLEEAIKEYVYKYTHSDFAVDVFDRQLSISDIKIFTTTDAVKNEFETEEQRAIMLGFLKEGIELNEFARESANPKPKAIRLSRQYVNRFALVNSQCAPELAKRSLKALNVLNTYEGYKAAAGRVDGPIGALAALFDEVAFSKRVMNEVRKNYESRREAIFGGEWLTEGAMQYVAHDWVAFLQILLGVAEEDTNGILTGNVVGTNKKLGLLRKGQIWSHKVAKAKVAVMRYPALLGTGNVMVNVAYVDADNAELHHYFDGITGVLFNIHDYALFNMGGDDDGDEVFIIKNRTVIECEKALKQLLGVTVIADHQNAGKLDATGILTSGWMTDGIASMSNMLMTAICKAIDTTGSKRAKCLEDARKIAALAQWYVDSWKKGLPDFKEIEDEIARLEREYGQLRPFSQKFKKSVFWEEDPVTGKAHQFFADGATVFQHEISNTLPIGNDCCDQLLKYVTGKDSIKDIAHVDNLRALGYTQEDVDKGLVSIIEEDVDNAGVITYDLAWEPIEFDGSIFQTVPTNVEDAWERLKLFEEKENGERRFVLINEVTKANIADLGLEITKHYVDCVYLVKDLWIAYVREIGKARHSDEEDELMVRKSEAEAAINDMLPKYIDVIKRQCIAVADKVIDFATVADGKHCFDLLCDLVAAVVFQDEGYELFGVDAKNEGSRQGFARFCMNVFGETWIKTATMNKEVAAFVPDEEIADCVEEVMD